MNVRRDIPVAVTDHARERMRQRFPGVKAARIVDEVRDAMGGGRFSASPPAWATMTSAGPDSLYAWTPDGERAYVVEVDNLHRGEFVVITVLRKGWTTDNQEAAA